MLGILSTKKARLRAPESQNPPLENHWVALRASLQNESKKSRSLLVVELYNSARTYFITKS